MALAPGVAGAVLRTRYGGVVRLPALGVEAVRDPGWVSTPEGAFQVALEHATLARMRADEGVDWPLLREPPTVDDTRAVMVLRGGMQWAPGRGVDAHAVLAAWRRVRAAPLGRLALSLVAPGAQPEALDPSTLRVTLVRRGALDDLGLAPPLAPTSVAGRQLRGLGAFSVDPQRDTRWVRNPSCPAGGAFLDSVSIVQHETRAEALRAFATRGVDASWWGPSLYGGERAVNTVQSRAGAVVGLIPGRGSRLANPGHARRIEQIAEALTGRQGLLSALTLGRGAAAPSTVEALRSAVGREVLQIARPLRDGMLDAVGERLVALFDAAGMRATLVGPDEGAALTLRAVAPVGRGEVWALASFFAVAASEVGDESGPAAMVGAEVPQQGALAAAVWSRSAAAVLGLWVPSLALDPRVEGARFDGLGRLVLDDAAFARAPG